MASGPPGAAWINRNTSTEIRNSSGTAWARRRASRRATDVSLFDFPFVYVPEDAGVRRIPLEMGERGGHRVQPGDGVEGDLRHLIGHDRLRAGKKFLARGAIDRPVRGVEQL